MVFSSSLFLVYFLPIFFIIYYNCGKRYKNVTLLIASLIFYAWGAPRFIFVLIGTTALDFYLVGLLFHSSSPVKRKTYLLLSLAVNLGLLLYCKYFNFFIENVNTLCTLIGLKNMPMVKLFLPLGISFYTFETITYVMDVYRGIHAPLHRFKDYLLYIFMFPKLVAGPIVRYNEIADQIIDRSEHDSFHHRISGFHRFCIGLGKKAIIANSIGAYVVTVDLVEPSSLTTSTAWLAAFAYSFQIYFDFSGYSDMALGLAKMLGFKLPENFNNPYIADSVTDFWRRWHISLGNWMRNYLYLPLGGNRVSNARMYFNLWVVFLVSGLWHGASWNFVLWGLTHGLMMVLERMILLKWYHYFPKLVRICFIFLLVTLSWVIFRIESIGKLRDVLKVMFIGGASSDSVILQHDVIPMMSIAFVFSWFCILTPGQKIQALIYHGGLSFYRQAWVTAVMMILYIIALAYVTASNFNPFIYFRF